MLQKSLVEMVSCWKYAEIFYLEKLINTGKAYSDRLY